MTAAAARYRILRRLGQGGMAEVFEAELAGDLGFVRKIAIKRMLGEAAADADAARRFLDEAQIASRLHHANIVSVLDVGLLEGLPFQVLELVDGIDAHQLQGRAGGVLPLEIALIIANDVAHALDHAHTATGGDGASLGIVHRDVKPSNVLVSWGGDVKLTDFGIAFAHQRVAKTEAGLVPGTMGFIAPEQRTKSEIDGRTDVFALGLTLHAMLTGYTPLQDITVEMAVLAGQPITLDKMLPADISALIARSVAPDRRDRPTAAQLADAIGGALAPRLTREPRGYLRAFLAPLHGSQPRRGKLDQLLGFDVILTSEGDAAAPRRFELRPTGQQAEHAPTDRDPPPPEALARAEAPTVAVPATPSPSPPAGSAGARSPADSIATTQRHPELTDRAPSAPRRSRAPLVAAIGLVLVGGTGLVAWRLAGHSGAGAHPADTGAVAVVAEDAAAADAPVVAPVGDDAGVAVSVVADAAVKVVDLHHAHRDAGAGAGSAAHVVGPPPPPPAGTGFVQVIGEANLGARILSDGREVGFAPNKLEVPLGHHKLTIVRKDGTQVTAELDVTDYNTVQHPARPSL